MGVREELEAGLEALRVGWFKGGAAPQSMHGDIDEQTCAFLAVPSYRAGEALHQQLPAQRHSMWCAAARCVIGFNNEPETTWNDIEELYKRAIVEAPLEDSIA